MQFKAKICKFYVKITAKFVNFPKCAKICNLYVKFDMNVEKRMVIGCGPREKKDHWV